MRKALIVLLSLLTLAVAQGKPKIAVYVTGAKDPGVDKALGTMMLSALVNSGRYQAVERSEEFLKQLAAEHSKQRSGTIENDQIKRLGKQFGVDFICIADITPALGSYSVSARIMNVESAEIVAMGNTDSQMSVLAELSDASQRIVAMMFGLPTPAQQARPTQPVQQARAASAQSTIEGTLVPGNSLTEKLAWLQRSAESHGTYILEMKSNENIAPHTFEYKGGVNITIVLRGDNVNRTIRLSSNGTMFTVKSNITLILDNNITLQGHNGNNGNIVEIKDGTLKMNAGATITGNMGGGGGVYVPSGSFEMTGGTISNNGKNTSFYGGGVDVRGNGTFTMSGGAIFGNKASFGGGVYVGGTFTMTGGTISGNTASKGGGAYRGSNGKFTIRSGAITGNTASEYGGGVCVEGGYGAIFNKTGGTITGYKDDQSNGNVVRDFDGVLARKGHAVYIDDDRRKESTIGPEVKLDSKDKGVWDQ